ncbi:MAG: T9SS type A sorting domain-containing protein [Bacteroidota bacterium]|nr:T9SS type A sorting domain-containing protein [Bacteroidota bacterium]
MKKLLLSILSLTALGLMAQMNVTGTWLFKPTEEAMAVGPSKGDYSWWNVPAAEITGARACQFDDEFVLSADGTFKNVFGEETFIEGWQGSEGCGAPVAPFDGSADATWSLDEKARTLTIHGKGAFMGIPKATNMKELTSVDGAPDSITYMVSMNADTLILEIQVNDEGAHWKFEFVKAADGSMSNDAMKNESLKVYPNPVNDMVFVAGVNAKSVINIRDFSGKVINSINGLDALSGINVSNLKTGAYLIEMTNNNNVQTAKFIKN